MISKTLCLGLFAFALVQAIPVPDESTSKPFSSYFTDFFTAAGEKTKVGVDKVVGVTNAGVNCVLHPLECTGKVVDGTLDAAKRLSVKAGETAKGVGDCVADKFHRGTNAVKVFAVGEAKVAGDVINELRGNKASNGTEGTGSSDNKVASGIVDPAKDSLKKIEKGVTDAKDFLDDKLGDAKNSADKVAADATNAAKEFGNKVLEGVENAKDDFTL